MKRRNIITSLILGVFILVLLSCSKEERTIPTDLVIHKIQHYFESDTFTEFYGWEDRKYLNRIVVEGKSKILFKYKDENISSIEYFYNSFNEANSPHYVDSFFYQDGVLHRQKEEYYYEETATKPNDVRNNYFEYDNDGQLAKKFNGLINVYEHYIWEEGNMISKEYRGINDSLLLVYFYDHDDKPNFNLNNPNWHDTPEQLSKNNITGFSWIENAIWVHYPMRPCVNTLEYYANEWPSKIEDCFHILEIEYHE